MALDDILKSVSALSFEDLMNYNDNEGGGNLGYLPLAMIIHL